MALPFLIYLKRLLEMSFWRYINGKALNHFFSFLSFSLTLAVHNFKFIYLPVNGRHIRIAALPKR